MKPRGGRNVSEPDLNLTPRSKLDRAGVEVRIDPEDGKAYTLNQLKTMAAGTYTDEEVEQYWFLKCQVVNDPVQRYAARVQTKCREASLQARLSAGGMEADADERPELSSASAPSRGRRHSVSAASLPRQSSGASIGRAGRQAVADARERFLQRQRSLSTVQGGRAAKKPATKDVKAINNKLGAKVLAKESWSEPASVALDPERSEEELRHCWELSRPELFGFMYEEDPEPRIEAKKAAPPARKRNWPCPAPPGGWPGNQQQPGSPPLPSTAVLIAPPELNPLSRTPRRRD